MPADYKTLLGLVREFVEMMDSQGGPYGELPITARARAAIAPSEPKPTNDPKILHTSQGEMGCCQAGFTRAGQIGKLDAGEPFICPRCCTEWVLDRKEAGGGLWIWAPKSSLVVIKR